MAAQFDLKKSSNGKFFFTLKASNGQAILSSEMYETRASASKGIASVQKNAADAARFQRLEGRGVELQPARGEASGDGVDLGSKELDIEHR